VTHKKQLTIFALNRSKELHVPFPIKWQLVACSTELTVLPEALIFISTRLYAPKSSTHIECILSLASLASRDPLGGAT
jgi:hypothetical protein